MQMIRGGALHTIANHLAIQQKDLNASWPSAPSRRPDISCCRAGRQRHGHSALTTTCDRTWWPTRVFAIIASLRSTTRRGELDAYDGFNQTNPRLSFIMTLALISLGGIRPSQACSPSSSPSCRPSTCRGHHAHGAPIYAGCSCLVNTVISLYYYLLIVKAMYIKHTDKPCPPSPPHTPSCPGHLHAGHRGLWRLSYVYNWITQTRLASSKGCFF
jgi:NADH-quinone oxidoreductase subunit N